MSYQKLENPTFDLIQVDKVKKAEEFDSILSGNDFVVVDFYATWCGPCKKIAPKIETLAKECKDVKFIKVDVDDDDGISDRFEVVAMPTFIIFVEGEVVHKIEGADYDAIAKAVDEL